MPNESVPKIRLDNVSRYFDAPAGRIVAVQHTSASIKAAEFITMVTS
jgi:hypothetical protein